MNVSVVIPAFNSQAYLAEAIESVCWQTREPEEIIVVDDGSTDCSAAIARSFAGVQLIQQPNRGVSAARNAGIRAAKADFVAFLDADDVWLPDKLALQQTALDASDGRRISWGLHLNFVEPGSMLPSWMPLDRLPLPVRYVLPSVLVAGRELFDTCGYFDETMTHGEDSDWIARTRHAGVPEAVVEEVVILRRLHSTNVSHDLARGVRGTMTVLRRSVAAHRQKATE